MKTKPTPNRALANLAWSLLALALAALFAYAVWGWLCLGVPPP